MTWTSGGPRAGNGCATMSLDGGGYRLMLCHVIFDRALGRGERLSQGQRIGTVGPPGTVGNNGAAHVHLDLSAGGRGSVPFASGSGLPLGGVDLPPRGRGNDHGGTVIPAGGEAVAESRSTTGETSSRGAAPRSTALSGAAVVQDTDGCLNVRATPSLAGRVVACLPEGTRVSIVEGPESANGRQWYRLAGRGWAAGDYLQETG